MRQISVYLAAGLALAVATVSHGAWGPNLLGTDPNSPAGFEDASTWGLHAWAYISDPPEPTRSGNHALVFQDLEGRVGYPNVWHPVTTVGNRRHFIGAYVREPNGPFNFRRLRLDPLMLTIDGGGTGYFQSRGGEVFLEGAGVVETHFRIQVQMTNWTNNRKCIFDDCRVLREIAEPAVTGDSLQGVLPIGEPATVIFYCEKVPSPTHLYAFDPDMTITADNATVTGYQWLSDTEIAVDVVADAAGAVNFTIVNDYGPVQTTYSMVAATPSACGDLGTIYLAADISGPDGQRDCYVDLHDFAALASDWMQTP